MAEADCDLCRAMGFRACDVCGDVAFPQNVTDSSEGRELCGYCVPTQRVSSTRGCRRWPEARPGSGGGQPRSPRDA
jgi:NifB/MoaA-like Fe-S oxidoreductase